MARDVEFNVTAADKTGTALASAEAKFKASQERIRKESKKTGDKLGDDVLGGADKAAKGLIGKLLPGFTTAGISGGQALGIGIAAAAPLIGATLSAAVIGGASAGGVLGGVYLASRDPRVKAAGATLGQNLLGELEKDAAPFVDPILRNVAKIEARFGQMNARIKNIFANSAGFLDPLVDGALNAVAGILRGVDALVAKGKPVIDAFGRAFSKIGQATGDAMEIISGGSDSAAKAVDDLSDAMQILIISAGLTIRALTEIYNYMTFIPRAIGAAERSLLGWDDQAKATANTTSVLAAGQKIATTIILSAGEAAGQAGLQMTTYSDRMNDATDKGRGLYDSQTRVAAAVSDTKKALKENSATLDINTEKGRANRDILSQLAGSLTANYQAYVKANGEGAAAGRVAAQNREQFIKLATQFGLTKTQAGNLATQMGLIPSKKQTDFYANTHDAEGRVKALAGRIADVHGKTVTIGVQIAKAQLDKVNNTLARLGGGAYSGGASFALTDTGSGVSRTGGPTPVSVSNNVSVSLDGAPFYAMTVRAIEANNRRQAWRQKAGRR